MKLLGIIFIVMSASTVGFKISSALKYKCTQFRSLIRAMQVMENEISCGHTSLASVFSVAAEHCEGSYQSVFRQMSASMEKDRWMSPRSALLSAMASPYEEVSEEILLELTGKLGTYDVDAQLHSIRSAAQRAGEILLGLEQERGAKSKTYKALSVCAGLAVAILLV